MLARSHIGHNLVILVDKHTFHSARERCHEGGVVLIVTEVARAGFRCCKFEYIFRSHLHCNFHIACHHILQSIAISHTHTHILKGACHGVELGDFVLCDCEILLCIVVRSIKRGIFNFGVIHLGDVFTHREGDYLGHFAENPRLFEQSCFAFEYANGKSAHIYCSASDGGF